MIILLDTVTFNPELVYALISIIIVIITFSGFFFNLRSRIELHKNDLDNLKETTKDNHKKLEDKVDSTYSKIENKISELEKKIQELPQTIIQLFKELK